MSAARLHRKEQQEAKKRTEEAKHSDRPNAMELLAQREQDRKFEAKRLIGAIKPDTSSSECETQKVGHGSRTVLPWESLLNWVFTIPKNSVPKEMCVNGKLCKVAAVRYMRDCLSGVNSSLERSWQFDMNKMSIACNSELSLTMDELITHDYGSDSTEHLHFPATYLGRQIKSSHLWLEPMKNMNMPALDLATWEPVYVSMRY
jgi:hypothetical protein